MQVSYLSTSFKMLSQVCICCDKVEVLHKKCSSLLVALLTIIHLLFLLLLFFTDKSLFSRFLYVLYIFVIFWLDKGPLEGIIRRPLKIKRGVLELGVRQLGESTAGLDSLGKVYQSREAIRRKDKSINHTMPAFQMN